MDHCFMRRRLRTTTLPIAVVRETQRGETRAHGLLSKHVNTVAKDGRQRHSIDVCCDVVNAVVGGLAAM